jgi:hypothetical protein
VQQAAKEGRELPPQLEPYMLAREGCTSSESGVVI